MANSIRRSESEDFEIVDGAHKVVGNVRIKPSGILWKPKGKHKWYGVAIDKFAEFAEEHGKLQQK
jgi:hypothetical protein